MGIFAFPEWCTSHQKIWNQQKLTEADSKMSRRINFLKSQRKLSRAHTHPHTHTHPQRSKKSKVMVPQSLVATGLIKNNWIQSRLVQALTKLMNCGSNNSNHFIQLSSSLYCSLFAPKSLEALVFVRVFGKRHFIQHVSRPVSARYSTLQHTTAHHSTLKHTTARYSTLQHATARYCTLQHTTAHYSTLQHTKALFNLLVLHSSPRISTDVDDFSLAKVTSLPDQNHPSQGRQIFLAFSVAMAAKAFQSYSSKDQQPTDWMKRNSQNLFFFARIRFLLIRSKDLSRDRFFWGREA